MTREPRILFRSEDLVVVDKPSGVATEPDKSRAPSLRDWVAGALGGTGSEAPHAVSRLDLGVSGAVTFATSARARAAAVRAKEQGRYERRYVALVRGALAEPTGLSETPIEGKPARTRHARIASASSSVALVLFTPETGRTHQIRIHAQRLGAAILGDRKYGGPSSVATASGRVVAVGRVLLHALAVAPRLGLPSDPPGFVVAPVPPDFIDLWTALDGDAEAWKDVDRCVGGSVQRS